MQPEVRRWLSALAAVALVVTMAAPTAANDGSGGTIRDVRASQASKPEPLTPRLQRLADPAIAALPVKARNRLLGLPESGPGTLVDRGGRRILVEIRVADTSATTLSELRDAGARIVHVAKDRLIVTAEVAPRAFRAVAAIPVVTAVYEASAPGLNGPPALEGLGNVIAAGCNPVISEGDTQLNVASARSTYGVDGTDIKVGVLSDSFDALGGAATDVAGGELPGVGNPCGRTTPVEVQADVVAGSDEGRAMAQIVHDLAPGATIRFATASNGTNDFADQIRALATAGASVIVDDITVWEAPLYQDGVVGKAVEDVSAAGVAYFSSAGNQTIIAGGESVGSYEANYRPTSCPAAIVDAVDCHDFDPAAATADATDRLMIGAGTTSMRLGWNEPEFGISVGYNLYFLNGNNGDLLFEGNENNLITQRAFQTLAVNWNQSNPFPLDVVVGRATGSATPRLKMVHWRSPLVAVEWNQSAGGDVVGPTIFSHNASRSGVTVAGIPYSNANVLETYSSTGPASYCWGPVDGTTSAPPLTPCQTATVDLAATDGGANSFFGAWDGTVYRFYGTSASAPHAAAVAALARDYQPCATGQQTIAGLTAGAVPFGSYGVDAEGAGRVDAVAGLAQTAAIAGCDVAPPLVNLSFPAPAASGWYTSAPVTGSVTATDALHTVVAITCTGATLGPIAGLGTASASASLTVSAQGSNDIACTATDSVGNAGADVGSTNAATLLIDSVAPTVVVTGVVDGAQYISGSQPTAGCETSDATSGVGTAAVLSITGGIGGAGLLTATCAGAYDVAGNPQTAAVSVSYTVVYAFAGFFSPVPDSQWSRGRTIPAKFALTDSAGIRIADSLADGLASGHRVRVRLLTAPAGSALSSAWCTSDAALDQFVCPLRMPGSATSGATYWIVAEEDLGTGFIVVPLGPGALTANPEPIVAR
jgi:hypothetical protein